MLRLTMGSLFLFAFSWWGLLLQGFAIIHFIRRRPDTFWLWVILIGGWLGALVYIFVEAVPDAGLLRQSFKAFPRRARIRELEAAVLDNPSAGNYEELSRPLSRQKKYARARQSYDKAISARTDSPDPFYRRAVAAVAMDDFAAALPDLDASSTRIRRTTSISQPVCSLTSTPTPASPKKPMPYSAK